MNFVSGTFLLFLPLTVFCFWLCPAHRRWLVLLAASYILYASSGIEMTLLLLGETVAAWAGGLALGRWKHKGLLPLVLCILFLPLIGFKYTRFLAENLSSMLGWPDPVALGWLARIVLPVGISFYTFQAASYVIDIARGEMAAERSLPRVVLFVSFFPQLVAGPIERAGDLMPQLRAAHMLREEELWRGLRLLVTGYFRKLCVADVLSPFVDAVFSAKAPDGSAVALGTILFAFQIYNDFAGYSEIALGCGHLLGIRLTRNFQEPYLAVGFRDFWRRWHITLNGWFRSYVYRPLQGGSSTKAKRLLAASAVFLLSGAWHGANWTFILWGILHAIFYNGEMLLIGPKITEVHGWRKLLVLAGTFMAVCFSWVLFRAQSVSQAFTLYGALFSPWHIAEGAATAGIALSDMPLLLALLPLTHLIGRWGFAARPSHTSDCLADMAIGVLLLLAIVLCGLSSMDAGVQNSFIYFQF